MNSKLHLMMLLLFTVINYVVSDLVDLKIGTTITESITQNKFYQLELTDRESEYLIINVKPKDNYEKFSDPDIFVSQVRKAKIINSFYYHIIILNLA